MSAVPGPACPDCEQAMVKAVYQTPEDDIFGQIMVHLNNSGLFGTGGTHSYDCGRLGILNVYMGRTGWDRTWMPIAGALPRDVAKKLSTETLEAMGQKAMEVRDEG